MSDDEEEHGLSRHEDPWTSHEAGDDVPATKLFGIIYRLLLRFPEGLTNSEISFYTGIVWNTCTPRMRQMANKGWVKELIINNKMQTRIPAAFGGKKKQIIWVAVRKEEFNVKQDNSRNPRKRRVARRPQRTPDSLPLFRFYDQDR